MIKSWHILGLAIVLFIISFVFFVVSLQEDSTTTYTFDTSLLEEIEAIEKVEGWRVEKSAYLEPEWSLTIHLEDDTSFYFKERETIDDLRKDLQQVERYISENF